THEIETLQQPNLDQTTKSFEDEK
ncbi:unnamed protein product, partial [Adineta steineri]